MDLAAFSKSCGFTVQPWQRPLLEAIMRGDKIRMMTEAECHKGERAEMRRRMAIFNKLFRK